MRGQFLSLLLSISLPLGAQRLPPNWKVTQDLKIEGDFNRLASIAVDPRGRMAVLDAGDLRLYLYSQTGTELARYGRKGEGPGEFTGVNGLGLTPKGFWVAETMALSATLLDGDLRLQEKIRTPSAVTGGGAFGPGMPTVLGVVSANELILNAPPPLTGPRALALFAIGKNGAGFVRVGRDGKVLNAIGTVRAAPHCAVEGPNRSGAAMPLCAEPMADVSRDGRRIAMLEPGKAPGTFRVAVVGIRGDTLFDRVVPYQPIRIPKAVADSVFEIARQLQPDVVTPQFFPPATRLLMGRDGSVWVQQVLGADKFQWLVIDPKAKVPGAVALPPRTRLLEADLQQLWGVARDDDDVPSIVRYRLTGSSASGR